ncbi:MAG TPA: PAS domain-containing protein [Dongiaceae bacterium]|nr:PAS domain-containing protein [Dongiaceae bacterium]
MATGDGHFDDFLARIQAPALIAVARHWGEARAGQRMPAWRDIDPLKIVPYLPIVWSWRYDRQSERFTGRLAGDAITRAFGRSLRGAELKSFFGDRSPMVFARYHRVVTEPCFSRDSGAVFRHVDGVGVGERIIMPLADDHQNGDGVFGATTYDLSALATENPVNYVFDSLEYLPL